MFLPHIRQINVTGSVKKIPGRTINRTFQALRYEDDGETNMYCAKGPLSYKAKQRLTAQLDGRRGYSLQIRAGRRIYTVQFEDKDLVEHPKFLCSTFTFKLPCVFVPFYWVLYASGKQELS